MDTYRFGGGEQRKPVGPLAPGDYHFVVAECGEPYPKQSGNWVVQARLSILPGGETVFATPWSGTDKNGEERDGIGSFLLAVNRAPGNKGDVPDWSKIAGAKGKCRLKVEVAQMGSLAGQEVNKVAFFYEPKQLKVPLSEHLPDKLQQAKQQAAEEPDDIPF